MFKTLKIKLTAINAMVLALIMLIFSIGIFAITSRGIESQAQTLMLQTAKDAGSLTPKQFNRRRHTYEPFYVKLDAAGAITEISSELPFNEEELKTLVLKALDERAREGNIEERIDRHKEHFLFLKAPLSGNGGGQIIVFTNFQRIEEMKRHLVGALFFTGLISIALTLLGSFYMANKALLPIKASWQRQKDFTADASHELRTPLAVIQTNLDIVKENAGETIASQMQWISNIEVETKMMAKLVEDLLFLARIDSDQQIINKEIFSIKDVLTNTVKKFDLLAHDKKLKIITGIGDLGFYFGDAIKIKQLFIILIDNAIKYTPEKGNITIHAERTHQAIEVSIKNSGPGIAQEHIDKIFNRFYRVDKARSRHEGGTGLGLAIAQWIVKEHNGKLSVVSTPEVETIFTVYFPI